MVLANDDGCRPDDSECQRSELVSYVYAPKDGILDTGFGWRPNDCEGRAHGRGAAYVMWWGT